MKEKIFSFIESCKTCGCKLSIVKGDLVLKGKRASINLVEVKSFLRENKSDIIEALKPILDFSDPNDSLEVWRVLYRKLKKSGLPVFELKNIFDNVPSDVLKNYSREYLKEMLLNYAQEMKYVDKELHKSNMTKTMRRINSILNDKYWGGNKGYKTMVYDDWTKEELSKWNSNELIDIYTNCLVEMRKNSKDFEYKRTLKKIRRYANSLLRGRRSRNV